MSEASTLRLAGLIGRTVVGPAMESNERGLRGEEGRFSLLFVVAMNSGRGARNKERGSSDNGGREEVEAIPAVEQDVGVTLRR